jgi:Putative restriction endonuclease
MFNFQLGQTTDKLLECSEEQSMSANVSTIEHDESVYPDTSLLITEDGKPVDNLFVEKLYHLLTEPLWTSWTAPDGKPFHMMANVGLFFEYKEPPLVPEVMIALGVEPPKDPRYKDNRSYFTWIVGKPPDIVIEVVSDKRGREDSEKLRAYERVGVKYYVIFDPDEILNEGVLRAYCLSPDKYRPIDPSRLGDTGLGLTLWDGQYNGVTNTWLRWIDSAGKLVPTGKEKAEAEKARADTATARADTERALGQAAMDRVRQLEDKLRAAGLSLNGTGQT